ncbi:MAG: HAD family hydrolase [Actinobacteria bacterium ATB1]|nr:HAD family hydrolase [Actinobacteria bacterium ATB1]
MPWYRQSVHDVATSLAVDPSGGLPDEEAAVRLEERGPNRLEEPARRPAWLRFLDQFRNGIVYILMGAAVLAALVGELKDPIIIGIVLLINAVLGYIQEARADKALDALRRMLTSTARVRRGGRVVEVPSEELVPGDIVLLEAGDRVPADGRLTLTVSAAIDESSVTGESLPVEKDAETILDDPEVPLADRLNTALMNTTLVRGRAEMVVTETGMATEMGHVAALLGTEDPGETPLQRQLDRLGKRLATVAVVAVLAVFALRLLEGDDLAEAALNAVALAVAAIPEGLPAVVTVTLAIGVSYMAKRNAIVKRLHAVETLGSTSVICSDKTGTLTMNQMTVKEVRIGDTAITVSGEGYGTDGELEVPGGDGGAAPTEYLRPAVLANDADVRNGEMVGDPTEGALVVLAQKASLDTAELRGGHPRLGEIPFDSTSKYMASFNADGDGVLVSVKGAPEVVISMCSAARLGSGETVSLDNSGREDRLRVNEELAAKGYRVLAVASRPLARAELEGAEDLTSLCTDLVLEGLLGIMDPPRPEAKRAIDLCRLAGISVKMITGDHASTAASIADQLGIEGRVVTGRDLDAMSDEELAVEIGKIGVCARVAPEHKVRVVDALRADGEITAMTGDGVNDAAALRGADIGVAMGITGTEVTKEAGDMVLADDNFATIVGAVERGRAIFDNILKFVRFQLSTNLGAIGTILGAGLLGLPMPLTAIQVLWVNIIADGPPAMTLGVDRPSPDVMRRQPRPPNAPILDWPRLSVMLLAAAAMTAGTLGVFVWADGAYGAEPAATMAFTTFVLFQMYNVFNARSLTATVFGRYSLTNSKLWIAVATVLLLQVGAVQWGPMRAIFDTTALSASQWAICIAVAASVIAVEEVRKMLVRLLGSRSAPADRARRS